MFEPVTLVNFASVCFVVVFLAEIMTMVLCAAFNARAWAIVTTVRHITNGFKSFVFFNNEVGEKSFSHSKNLRL